MNRSVVVSVRIGWLEGSDAARSAGTRGRGRRGNEEAALVSAVGLGGHSRDHVAEAQSARLI